MCLFKLFKGKNILITGGTGSLGQALTKKLLTYNPKVIRIFSRNEINQINMKNKFNDKRLNFLIGDIRDKPRLKRAVEDIDIVVHAAALKHIDVGEYNPFEFIKTNIEGSQNVVDVCMDEEVDILLGISTDKAVSPLNLYGATKLTMEKLIIAGNHYKGKRKTKFSCVRYGNVFASQGSVVPKFLEQINSTGIVTVTDNSMTRFSITMNDALDLIIFALQKSKGGEVFVPKLKAYRVRDLVESLKIISKKEFKTKKIPIRPGEKMHEVLLNIYEIKSSLDIGYCYILFSMENQEVFKKIYTNSKPVNMISYSSDDVKLLSPHDLKLIFVKENLISSSQKI